MVLAVPRHPPRCPRPRRARCCRHLQPGPHPQRRHGRPHRQPQPHGHPHPHPNQPVFALSSSSASSEERVSELSSCGAGGRLPNSTSSNSVSIAGVGMSKRRAAYLLLAARRGALWSCFRTAARSPESGLRHQNRLAAIVPRAERGPRGGEALRVRERNDAHADGCCRHSARARAQATHDHQQDRVRRSRAHES